MPPKIGRPKKTEKKLIKNQNQRKKVKMENDRNKFKLKQIKNEIKECLEYKEKYQKYLNPKLLRLL